MKKSLWSMSTTVRESNRIKGFLKVASLMEGEEWDVQGQKRFQYLLVQKREYLNDPENGQTFQKLNEEQIRWLSFKELDMPYDIAISIIEAKNYVGGAEMRGRQSMSPLRKLGLVYIDTNNKVRISDIGRKLINEEITDEEFFLDSLLKIQYPNPLDDSYPDMNIKPFIGILALIKRVNDLCDERGIKAKGLSKDEFGIFGLSLYDYRTINSVAERVLEYRTQYEQIEDDDEKKIFKESFINTYLEDFKEPVKNVPEYADNMIRYFRQTKLFFIRGKYAYTYFDLEPRRMNEITSILENDDAKPLQFETEKEWIDYFSTYGTYVLPYETEGKLREIAMIVVNENYALSLELKKDYNWPSLDGADRTRLKEIIGEQRELRTLLQNLKIKKDFFDVEKIEEVVEYLTYIVNHDRDRRLQSRMCLELEKWTNVALNIFNDAVLIKPNTIVGDDNEPINTAPAGVADIECYYNDFDSICEVTTLTSRDQWINEGQPVMRHLRSFENRTAAKCYCLFVAPRLHQDTVNTFWNSVKYEYEGKKQFIIPITIGQLIMLLNGVKKLHEKQIALKSEQLASLYDACTNLDGVASSVEWIPNIGKCIDNWVNNL